MSRNFYAIDELYFQGTAEELVTVLHKASRAPCATDEMWMQETAKRMLTQSGVIIRTDNPINFIDDLLETNYLHGLITANPKGE